ncbi:hypothetical protein H0H93_012648, partial [Arthromyces matolae]
FEMVLVWPHAFSDKLDGKPDSARHYGWNMAPIVSGLQPSQNLGRLRPLTHPTLKPLGKALGAKKIHAEDSFLFMTKDCEVPILPDGSLFNVEEPIPNSPIKINWLDAEKVVREITVIWALVRIL